MIGIISDTHDNVESIKKAVKIFKDRKIDLVIHCGDIVAPLTIQFFEGLNIKFVRGNCDGDILKLKEKAEEINAEFFDEAYEFDYKNKKFIAYHGTNPEKLSALIKSEKYDYILTGHTHLRNDEKFNKTRVINPGAFYPITPEKTIAILDVKNDKLEFLNFL